MIETPTQRLGSKPTGNSFGLQADDHAHFEPLMHLRFRCSNCGSDRTDFVVTLRDNPQPW